MELDDCDGSPSDQLWPLTKVIGKSLDPGKHWFVLTKDICGIKPNKFTQNVDFQTKYGPCREQTSSLSYKVVPSAYGRKIFLWCHRLVSVLDYFDSEKLI